ncbi:hypothetical protein GJ700_28645 [Duganella sp. FT92W]|uniref:Ketosynthase family 3 (KS3) domain-containing protein n=1 Tax=Pseudoduganella rivuli TaxID=2666085 RepID=A0A7X2LW75_9BURK|nr:beta-ketoacyl-[acyl-carrier-protein] synthase family protein [Pseudoduganella rivuli]MRV75693.1 hypothetical protein [Pseudoduganella rivuli]
MTKCRVVVTGIGAVSPYGVGVDAYWQGLLSGRTAIGPVPHFEGHGYRSTLGAQVPAAVTDGMTAHEAQEKGAFLVALAADEALRMAGVGPRFSSGTQVGCVLGSLCAGIENLIAMAEAYHTGAGLDDNFPGEAALVNYQLEFLAARHNLTGPTSMVSTACASTTDAIGYGADLVRQGDCDAVLVGGGDILAALIHAGFNSLFSITTTSPKPFDTGRDGFAIGEGAGIFYLETLDSALARGARIYAEVSGYGLSNTAFHLTATSDDGMGEAQSVERALADAGLTARQIDYVNAHGTATVHNDRTEMKAIGHVFGERAGEVLVNSNKPLIGHCMGAAGIMEAISTVLSLEHQLIPPTPHTAGNEPALSADLVMGAPRPAALTHAISQSFGFGGACSCVVLSRVNSVEA